jgi:beta-exotoxin I transport system permease protein
VILPALRMTLRLRMLTTALTAFGVILVILLVGALFPAVGSSIGKLNLPKGVTTLLGGADYATLTGWMRSEIGAVYGPLLLAYTGISVAASTAGDEESGILALTLSYPVARTRLVLAKAAAVMICVALVALATFAGLVIGVAIGGGGISLANIAAVSLHLAFFGWAAGALALALAASTGRRAVAAGGAAAFALLGFLVNGFAPLVDALAWLKYFSLFYYYEGHDPIANGIDTADLAVLAVATLALIAVAVVGIRHRDLRK